MMALRPAVNQEADAVAKTVLIADDDALFLTRLARLLRTHGYETLAVLDGITAWNLLEKLHARIDLLIVDLALPGLSGPSLIRAVAGQRTRRPEILATTAVLRQTVLESTLLLGAGDVIRKPGADQEWLEAVGRLIGRNDRGSIRRATAANFRAPCRARCRNPG
jgi:CheY-like chemotaxis protein